MIRTEYATGHVDGTPTRFRPTNREDTEAAAPLRVSMTVPVPAPRRDLVGV